MINDSHDTGESVDPVVPETAETAAPQFDAPESVQKMEADAPKEYGQHDEENPLVQDWLKGAKVMGYEDRLAEGESLYDLYRKFNNLPETATVAETPDEAQVPTEEVLPIEEDTSVEIPDTDEEASADAEPEIATNRVTQEMWSEMTTSVMETGSITDDHRTAVKESWGVDDSVIDTYLEGLKVTQRKHFTEAATVVGDEGTLKEVLNWAAANYPKEQKDTMNEALRGPNRDLVLKGIKADFDASTSEAKIARAAEPSTSKETMKQQAPLAIKAFKSQYEMMEHVKDPRYAKDPAYRQYVQDRINKSAGLS